MNLKQQLLYVTGPVSPVRKAEIFVSELSTKAAYNLRRSIKFGNQTIEGICKEYDLDEDTFKRELQGKSIDYEDMIMSRLL